MLLRIFLILAILAGLGAGGIAYYEFSTQIPQLQTQRDTEKDAKVKEIDAHNKTKATLKKTQADLAQTQSDLADTKTELTKTQERADSLEKRANDLTTKLAKTAAELEDTKNQLVEYQASGLKPAEVAALTKDLANARKEIAAITDERNIIKHQYDLTKAKLDSLLNPENVVKLPASLKGKILVVDPKWDFVVLDVGDQQGVLEDGEMLVSRDGKLVAKVVIRTVQKDRCIANIVPGWKLGELIEGDVVTPAHPTST